MGSGEAKKFREMYGSAGRHGETFWTEETKTGNVGLKLLKSMGWEHGQGLGKNETGSATHIKTTRRQDNRGVGASAATRDETYKASQDLFSGILARLNCKEGETPAEESNGLGGAETTVKGVIAKRSLGNRFRRAKVPANRPLKKHTMPHHKTSSIYQKAPVDLLSGTRW